LQAGFGAERGKAVSATYNYERIDLFHTSIIAEIQNQRKSPET
jgi:hypothetical protein